MALYEILINWKLDVLRNEYKNLGIPKRLVKESLHEGVWQLQ